MNRATRILVADDHPLVREGLKRLISDESDFELVGEAETGTEAVERCRKEPVDVLLLDITMPGPGFSEVLARISSLDPAPAVLILSMHPEERYAVRALRDGADGYLTKGQSPRVIAAAIRIVAEGGTYVSPEVATTIVAELQGHLRPEGVESLSRREFQILRKLGAGMTLTEVAKEISLSPKTVSTYRTRVLQKLHLRTTAELVRYAIEHDLTA